MAKKPLSTGPDSDLHIHEWVDALVTNPEFIRSIEEEQRKIGELEELRKVIDVVRKNVRGMEAANLHGEIVQEKTWAPEILARRERLFLARKTAEVLLTKDVRQLNGLRDFFEKQGGLFDPYTLAFIEERLEQPANAQEGGWVVSLGIGQTYNDLLQVIPGEIVGADVQLFVPPDVKNAELPKELVLGDTDVIDPNFAPLYREICKNPQTAAWLSDVTSDRGVQRPDGRNFTVHGFAKTATNRAYDAVEAMNVQRQFPVKWSLAAIAAIAGLRNASGEEIVRVPAPLQSKMSMGLHSRSRIKGGAELQSFPLGTKMGSLTEVSMPDGSTYFVEINWNILAQEQVVPERSASVTVPQLPDEMGQKQDGRPSGK